MKMKLAATVSLLLLSGAGWAQQCPEGIPSAGNPQCLPPQDERSPYHQGSGYGNDAPVAPSPIWAPRWGAIASDGNGAYGIVADITSERKAKKAAIQECRNRGGGACTLRRSYVNQCAAVVVSDTWSAYANAPTIKRAIEIGQHDCSGSMTGECRVYYSGCSDAVRVN